MSSLWGHFCFGGGEWLARWNDADRTKLASMPADGVDMMLTAEIVSERRKSRPHARPPPK